MFNAEFLRSALRLKKEFCPRLTQINARIRGFYFLHSCRFALFAGKTLNFAFLSRISRANHSLMLKMSDAGEDHCNAVLIGGGDGFVVLN